MLLYHDLRAPNPRRVRIFLAEKGVAYDTIEVSIATSAEPGAHGVPARKNPLALLPVHELADGRILRESMAICRYIEELHPEPNLFGTDTWERAQIEQWNRHAELEVLVADRSRSSATRTHSGRAGSSRCPSSPRSCAELLAQGASTSSTASSPHRAVPSPAIASPSPTSPPRARSTSRASRRSASTPPRIRTSQRGTRAIGTSSRRARRRRQATRASGPGARLLLDLDLPGCPSPDACRLLLLSYQALAAIVGRAQPWPARMTSSARLSRP